MGKIPYLEGYVSFIRHGWSFYVTRCECVQAQEDIVKYYFGSCWHVFHLPESSRKHSCCEEAGNSKQRSKHIHDEQGDQLQYMHKKVFTCFKWFFSTNLSEREGLGKMQCRDMQWSHTIAHALGPWLLCGQKSTGSHLGAATDLINSADMLTSCRLLQTLPNAFWYVKWNKICLNQ